MRTLAILTLLCCGVSLTSRRASQYQSNVLIWAHDARATPTFRAWANYRNALLASGDWDGAADTCWMLSITMQSDLERRTFARFCRVVP